jgi:hypothetical protein
MARRGALESLMGQWSVCEQVTSSYSKAAFRFFTPIAATHLLESMEMTATCDFKPILITDNRIPLEMMR